MNGDDRSTGTHRPHLLAEIDERDTRGSITVDPNVLVEVIELTARSIDGISGFVSAKKAAGHTHSIVDGPEPRADGSWHEQHGIRVNLTDGVIDAELTITVESGIAIPGLASELQDRLRVSAERLLGFRIGSLSIRVADVVAPLTKGEGS
jgi:uncharacterized alkaline shock family protein YloU